MNNPNPNSPIFSIAPQSSNLDHQNIGNKPNIKMFNFDHKQV